MFALSREERIILIFLSLAFVGGLALRAYKRGVNSLELTVQPHKEIYLKEADSFIQERNYVNINSADINELARLPGVGEELAARIVQYRQSQGPFKSKEELLQVKGIGQKRFKQLKGLIVVK